MGFLSDLLALALALLDPLKSLALASARPLGLTLVFPLFTRPELGKMVRGAFAVGLALPVWPHVHEALTGASIASTATFSAMALKEVVLGALLGLLLGMPFWAFQAAAEFIDNQRSLSNSSGGSDPSTKSESSAFSVLLSVSALTLFISADGLQALLRSVYDSYAIWPAVSTFPHLAQNDLGLVLDVLGRLVEVGLLIAAPALIVLLVADLGLAIAAKASSNLNLYNLSTVLRNLIFLLFITVYLTFLTDYMKTAMSPDRILGPELARRLR